MTVHEISVAGLLSGYSAQVLERNLSRLHGVKEVTIESAFGEGPSVGTVHVRVDPRYVTREALETAVRDSGLHVRRAFRDLAPAWEDPDEEPGGDES